MVLPKVTKSTNRSRNRRTGSFCAQMPKRKGGISDLKAAVEYSWKDYTCNYGGYHGEMWNAGAVYKSRDRK
eukprot:Clim_evm70s218 gene=Clim_evmTU70s218